MIKLKRILKDLLSYKYSQIPVKRGRPIWLSFEDEIELMLIAWKFRRTSPELMEFIGLTVEDIDNRRDEINCPYNFFVRNPKGGSKSPDFLVCETGKIFYLECKTSRGAYKPMWGSHFPEGKEIWIFCCGKGGKTFQIDKTTIFLGEDRISPKIAQELHERQRHWLEEDRAENARLREKYGDIGLDLRPRKFVDAAAMEISPIHHPDRKEREDRVLAFVQETLEFKGVDKALKLCYNFNTTFSFR
jgi:hypothetical protein